MSDVTKQDFEDLQKRVENLEDMLLIAFRDKAERAKHSVRRIKKLQENTELQYSLFDGLSCDLEGIISLRKGGAA